MPPASIQRLYGLDAWRALLLSLGPVFHAALIGADMYGLPDSKWLGSIATVLHSFRMEAFFVISGFLMAYRSNVASLAWLRLRSRQLALPLLTCWITVLPLSRLFAAWRGGPGTGWSPLDPVHLWFLVTLLAITPVLWCAARSARLDDLVRVLERRPVLWGGAVATAIACVLVGRAVLHLLPERDHPALIIPMTLAAAPYYGLFALGGLVAARSKGIMAHLSCSSSWLLGPAVLIGYAVAVYRFDATPGPYAAADHSTAGIILYLVRLVLPVPVAACMAYCVLVLGVRPTKPNRLVSGMTDAAFTVYLFHLLPLEVLAWWPGSRLPPAAYFAVASVGSLAISLGFHALLIRPSAFGRAVFNGRFATRILPRAPAATYRHDP